MSEFEAYYFCENCNESTIHLFSGSGRKGVCMSCGHELSPFVSMDYKKVISWSDDCYEEVIE